MRLMRTIPCCLLVALTVCASNALAAWAAPPDIGRCKLEGSRTDKAFVYKNKTCTKLASPANTGEYEWFPLPTGSPAPKLGFTAHGTKATLESVLGAKVACEEENATGAYTGDKTIGELRVKFGPNCSSVGVAKCNSAGEPAGTIVTNDLAGEVHWADGPEARKVVLDLTPESEPLFAEIECVLNQLVERIKVKGSLLVAIPAGKMQMTLVEKFKEQKGKQKPEFYEESVGTKTYDFLESSNLEGFAQSGQMFTNTQTNEESLEANWFA